MRFKKSPLLPGAGRTGVGHGHGRHMPTSPEAVLLGKMAYRTKQIRRQCMLPFFSHSRSELEFRYHFCFQDNHIYSLVVTF